MPSYRLAITALFFIAALFGCADNSSQLTKAGIDSQHETDIARGRYLIEIMGCNDCHTSDIVDGSTQISQEDWLIGGTRGFYGPWGTVYPTNLRLLLNQISEQEWIVLARRMRNNSPMAWSWLPKVTDEDLQAIYRFVKHLGPKGNPAPEPLPPGVRPTTDYINFPLPH